MSKLVGFDGSETEFAYSNTNGEGVRLLNKVQTPSGLVLQYRYDDRHRLADIGCGSGWKLPLDYDEAGRIVSYGYRTLR